VSIKFLVDFQEGIGKILRETSFSSSHGQNINDKVGRHISKKSLKGLSILSA